VDDGRRARWAHRFGYALGSVLTLWLVLVVGSLVGSDLVPRTNIGADDAVREAQGFEASEPSSTADPGGQTPVTLASERLGAQGSPPPSPASDIKAMASTPGRRSVGRPATEVGATPTTTVGPSTAPDEIATAPTEVATTSPEPADASDPAPDPADDRSRFAPWAS
jgi:hypothetical protein